MPLRALLILAGGSGSRLGHIYKPVLAFKGMPVILKVISCFTRFINEVIVSVRNKEQVRVLANILPCSVRVITDVISNYGPLAGIYTGLLNIASDLTYIAPADMPYISLRTYLRLEEFVLAGYEAAVPEWPNGYIEPLNTVVISKVALKAAAKLLDVGIKRVSQLYTLLRTAHVPVHYLTNNPSAEFLNLNKLNDLRENP